MIERNFQNRTLYHGDNLEFLRGMNSNTVDLVATDPPFNKGRDFHATPDSVSAGASFQDRWSWNRDVHEDWVDSLADDWPKTLNVIQGSRNSYGDDMGAFLCFMAVRLIEMRRVLKPTGSIYVHCDPTASHYLKELLDAIFGRWHFQNDIVWMRSLSHNMKSKGFQRVNDVLLYYTKSDDYTFNDVYEGYSAAQLKRYKKEAGTGRLFKAENLTFSTANKSRQFEWRGTKPPPHRSWGASYEQLEEWYGQGRILLKKNDCPRMDGLKVYLDEMPGKPATTNWTDIPRIGNTSKERIGYPTQKPLALYERIIRASSNEGDLVLDPFCGCATTPVAAERLGRQWVGMDIWDKAHEVVLNRLRDEGLIADGKAATGRLLTTGQVHYSTEPPVRTDANEETIPFLAVQQREKEPSDGMSNAQRKAELLRRMAEKYSGKLLCEGCFREFDHERYFVLDHVTPRSYGGSNNIGNRMLLCWPCNRDKSDDKTVGGLHKMNLRAGTMKPGVVREDVTAYRKRVATKR